MSTAEQVLEALGVLEAQLLVLSLDEHADEMTTLVVQRQQLLEAYLRSIPANEIAPEFVDRTQRVNDALKNTVHTAHAQAAQELAALSRGKSAMTAYQNQASSDC